MSEYKKYKFVDDYIETAVGSQGETNFYSLEECATEMNRLSEENKNLEVELIKENGGNYELKQRCFLLGFLVAKDVCHMNGCFGIDERDKIFKNYCGYDYEEAMRKVDKLKEKMKKLNSWE